MSANVTIRLEKEARFGIKKKVVVPGHRIDFSGYAFLHFCSEAERLPLLRAVAAHIVGEDVKTVFCDNFLCDELLDNELANLDSITVIDDAEVLISLLPRFEGQKVLILSGLAASYLNLQAKCLDAGVDCTTLRDLALDHFDIVPEQCFIPIEKNIYPMALPDMSFKPGLDLILMDCPARNLSMMPNGLGYVHNALKKNNVRYQTYDLDIVAYHKFHMHRLYDMGGEIQLSSGLVLPKDPWQAENYDMWSNAEVIAYFMPIIREAAEKIIKARPKMLGLSIQQCSEAFSTELVKIVKQRRPEIKIIVGGFSCYNPDIGFKAFPLADYMCIGESDLTVAGLISAVAAGESPKDMPGVLSRDDSKGRLFIPAPMPNDLDELDDPRYEWFPLSIYRNWDGYQLTPVIASRGCRWSRCTFCAERFYWRVRDPEKFVDELEYLVGEGCSLFMFNESDFNGNPDTVLAICDEIIRRGLRIKLTAQLRIHKKSDRAFFEKLKAAGFVALRFGVDAFSENTLRLQKKGYTMATVEQNLRDCWESGIYTEVNWVIGVPGETDQDCREGVDFILKNRRFIGRIANINPLILVNGSVYWIDPEAHGICFKEDKEEIFEKNDRYVPSSLWYSVDPYIDATVRKKRFENIVIDLIDNDFPLGPWAQKIYEEVKTARDKARTA